MDAMLDVEFSQHVFPELNLGMGGGHACEVLNTHACFHHLCMLSSIPILIVPGLPAARGTTTSHADASSTECDAAIAWLANHQNPWHK